MPNFPDKILELEFDKDGKLVHPEQVDAISAAVKASNATDLIVMSHGWNNDMGEARSLYKGLRDHIAAQVPAVPGAAGRTFVVAGVLWPSKKFAESDLIPGGAAAASDAKADGIIQKQLDTLEKLIDDKKLKADFEKAKKAAAKMDDDSVEGKKAQQEFVAIVLSHLPKELADHGTEPHADAMKKFDKTKLLDTLGRPTVDAPAPRRGGGASIDNPAPAAAKPHGGAAGLGDMFGGIKAGAMNLLNFVTYYQMKNRAGDIGRGGASAALRTIKAAAPNIRIHLVGHSFGGRLVTAIALGPDGQGALGVESMSLLQAAYSHYGLGAKQDGIADGFFRKVVTEKRVSGPVIITHTRNDKAVGTAYAMASRVARQVGAALGDASDQYGGMGSNGAQHTPESVEETLHVPGTAYPFAGGKVYNLLADKFVSGHSDITNDPVAYAVVSAIATT
ncbi:MAG: hypothetical protein M3081_22900 [Gemmatimonadota bacterium]|nr:hypothetical protein [Gemmatimonadota bacterium]